MQLYSIARAWSSRPTPVAPPDSPLSGGNPSDLVAIATGPGYTIHERKQAILELQAQVGETEARRLLRHELRLIRAFGETW